MSDLSSMMSGAGLVVVALILCGALLPFCFPLLFFSAGPLKWISRLARGVIAALLLAAVGIGLLGTIWVETTLRWAVASVDMGQGFAIDFKSAKGSLFAGQLELAGVSLKQADPSYFQYNLACEHVKVSVDLAKLLQNQMHCRDVAISGITGEVRQTAPAPDDAPPSPPFFVERLTVSQADLAVVDETAPRGVMETTLAIDSLEVTQFDANELAYAVLIRGNLDGALAGQPIHVRSEATPEGRTFRWNCDVLPLDLAAAYFGGPFEMMSGGRVLADVRSLKPVQDGDRELQLDWKMVLHGIRLDLPEGDRPVGRVLAALAEQFVSEQQFEAPIDFQMQLDRAAFDGEVLPLASSAWKSVGDAVMEKLQSKLGAPKSIGKIPLSVDDAQATIERTANRAIEKVEDKIRGKFDGLFNRLRKKPLDE